MHAKKWRIPYHSIRFQLITGIIVSLLPFCIYFIYNNNYAVNVVRSQVANTNRKLLSLYMREIDNDFHNQEIYFSSNLQNDTDFWSLQADGEQSSYELMKEHIYIKLTSDISQFNYIDAIFVYLPSRKDYFTVEGENGTDYTLKSDIHNFLCSAIDAYQAGRAGNILQAYNVQKIDNRYIIYRILQNGGLYMGSYVFADSLNIPLSLMSVGQNYKSLFVDTDGNEMDGRGLLKADRIKLEQSSGYTIAGYQNKFLVVSQPSSEGDFSLVALIPDKAILENLFYLRYISTIISVLSILLIPILLLFLQKTVLKPLWRIVLAMKAVQNGDMDVRLSLQNPSEEVAVMSSTFNRMMDQIKELKISVYEEQIGKQKEELQNLQLQIKPHFLMNALNIVYSLAELKDYRLIQEMSLSLSKYYGYISRKKTTFVQLYEELDHAQNYLKIQELRFAGAFTCEIHAEEELRNALVPPLLIQTFVENAVKHGLLMEASTHLSVDVTREQGADEPSMIIRVGNTGRSFEPEILEKLRSGKRIVDERGEHIGIWNTQRRLELLYSGKAQIAFRNLQPHGTEIEIRIPVQF